MKTIEEKRMVKLDFLFFSLFQNYLLGHISKKIAHPFCGGWSFLLIHI